MRTLFIICFTLFCFTGKSQLDHGFMGKKNLISVSANGGVSLLYMMRTNGLYYSSSNPYYFEKPWLRVGYCFEYQRLISKRVSIGVEAGYSNQRMRSQGVDFYDNFTYGYLHASLAPEFHSYTLTPTLSIGRLGSMSFSGFSYQFGIGPSFHKLNKEKTRFSSNVFNSLEEMVIDPEKLLIGMTAFIQLNYKFALAKGIYFDLGMKIKGDFHFGLTRDYSSQLSFNNSVPAVYESNLRDWVKQRGFYDVFSLKLGLAYQF